MNIFLIYYNLETYRNIIKMFISYHVAIILIYFNTIIYNFIIILHIFHTNANP